MYALQRGEVESVGGCEKKAMLTLTLDPAVQVVRDNY